MGAGAPGHPDSRGAWCGCPVLPCPLLQLLVRDAVLGHELVEHQDPDDHVHLQGRGKWVWGGAPGTLGPAPQPRAARDVARPPAGEERSSREDAKPPGDGGATSSTQTLVPLPCRPLLEPQSLAGVLHPRRSCQTPNLPCDGSPGPPPPLLGLTAVCEARSPSGMESRGQAGVGANRPLPGAVKHASRLAVTPRGAPVLRRPQKGPQVTTSPAAATPRLTLRPHP